MGQEHNINEEQVGMTHYPLVAYHGTSADNAKKIMEGGFRTGLGVRGEGIYASSDPGAASKYARNWEGGGAVVRVILHPTQPITTDETGRVGTQNYELPEHDVWEIKDRLWKYADDDQPKTYLIGKKESATPLDYIDPET